MPDDVVRSLRDRPAPGPALLDWRRGTQTAWPLRDRRPARRPRVARGPLVALNIRPVPKEIDR